MIPVGRNLKGPDGFLTTSAWLRETFVDPRCKVVFCLEIIDCVMRQNNYVFWSQETPGCSPICPEWLALERPARVAIAPPGLVQWKRCER